jgi:1-deoxy-D-xylulose-5-phosphate reductoisomerase
VAAFLERKIGFLDIAGIVEAVLEEFGAPPANDLASVLSLDSRARAVAQGFATARAA